MFLRAARAWLAGCVALGWSAGARAGDSHRPGLNWVRLEGAESCVSAASLAARIEARVGKVLFASPDEAQLFVDGSVHKGGAGWDVTLEVSEPDGRVLGKRSMHFDGADCAVIDEGVALVIAVTLYPNTGLTDGGVPLDKGTAGSLDALFGDEPTDPDPASLSAPAAARAVTGGAASTTAPSSGAGTKSIATQSASPSSRGEDWGLAVDAAPTLGFGQLPGVGLGLSAHVQITLPSMWPIELGAATFVPRTLHASGGVAGETRFELMLASAALCPWQPSWWPALALCAGAEVGRLHVAPAGFAMLESASSDFVANLLGAGVLRLRLLGGLYLRAGLFLALPLIQRGYGYQTRAGTSAQLYRMPPFAGRAEIGLGWRF